MRIEGIQHLSLVDFPKKLAAVVFTVGCNFRCPFCHNPSLVVDFSKKSNVLKDDVFVSEDDVFEFLNQRKNQLDGVVISGGEPTLHQDLPEFIGKIRSLGYAIKLDTNGSNPKMLQSLIDAGLIDYVAMDIKHTWDNYPRAAGIQDVAKIRQSVAILLQEKIDYEFRTTIIRELHSPEDIVEMSKQIRGARSYALQEFVPQITLDPSFKNNHPFDREQLNVIEPQILRNVRHLDIRL